MFRRVLNKPLRRIGATKKVISFCVSQSLNSILIYIFSRHILHHLRRTHNPLQQSHIGEIYWINISGPLVL